MRAYKSPAIHRTPFYRANAAYYGMEARCLNRNGRNPSYADVELRMTREDWLAWAVPEYERFLREHPDEVPNAARIGDSGHYELGNVRVVSRGENCRETRKYLIIDGKKTCSKCGNNLPIDDFSRNKRRRDGRSYWCKGCVRKYQNGRMVFNG